jgi:hypothetical protein
VKGLDGPAGLSRWPPAGFAVPGANWQERPEYLEWAASEVIPALG